MNIKPKVVISKCITFDHCRFNGGIINDEFVEMMKDYVEFIPVCPEYEIGLGVPRDALRLVLNDKGQSRIIQTKSEIDYTDTLEEYSKDLFNILEDIDGFILKNRSPSCGINDTKIYKTIESKIQVNKGPGIFGGLVKENYPNLAIANEGQLRNFNLREDFLTKLYAIRRFKKVKKDNKMKDLINYQANHKFIFMAFNEEAMRKLGKITANLEKLPVEEVINNYEKVLNEVFSKTTKYTKHINVLQHCYGFVSDELSKDEKDFFMNNLEKYRNEKIPLSVLQGILQTWIIKYDIEYLKDQVYFQPFPEGLMIIKDSGTGRDL